MTIFFVPHRILHQYFVLKLLPIVIGIQIFSQSELFAADLHVETGDHLLLTVQQNGTFIALKTQKENLLSPQSPSGIWLHDVVTGKTENCLGYVEPTPTPTGIVFSGNVQNMEIKVHAEFIPTDEYIRIAGYIEDQSDRERAIELMFRFYCNAQGAEWYRDIQVSKDISVKNIVCSTTLGRLIQDMFRLEDPFPLNTIYPFHGLAFPENRGAFALGVSPEEPAVYEFVYEHGEYYELKLKYGLSQYASGKLHKKAHFEVLLYRFSPEWGFRSVVDRYYQFHEKWFKKRAERTGLWLWTKRSEDVPNPWDYAYREGGVKGWEYDEAHGIATCHYLIVGQRELRNPDELPKKYEDQMALFEAHGEENDRPHAPDSFYRSASVKEVIEHSGLYDAQDRFRVLPRDTSWAGKCLTFPVNPDPDLFFDRPVPTVGKVTLEWVKWLFQEYPFLDGLYLDSLYAWAEYFNCRKEHFPYTYISLTYDPESKRPAIYNAFSHLEYLYAVREILYPEKKLLFANGIRRGRFFIGMAMDVLGSENSLASLVRHDYESLIYKRVVAYQKPYLLLDTSEDDILDAKTFKYLWQLGLFFGIHPGIDWKYQGDANLYEQHKSLITQYNALITQLNKAGWEPLTFAKTDNPEVWIERFGDIDSGLYFTLMNTSTQQQEVTITLEDKTLHLTDALSGVDLVSMEELMIQNHQIHSVLEATTCKVVKIIKKTFRGKSSGATP